mmetsp:Transcript_23590/g.54512  ORF Transcript_23590/g.54512 Transcript_23590/m.54512 type:complete len:464 (-) Transcript_23590:74-1465(-)
MTLSALLALGSGVLAYASVPVPGCTCIEHGLSTTMMMGHPVIHPLVGGERVPYPAFYGQACGKQPEPFSSSCYNTSTDPPTELVEGVRAAWCDDPWCYVDPCTCKLEDIALSTYFPNETIYFSYSNCGGADTFSNPEQFTFDDDCSATYTPAEDAQCALKFGHGSPLVNCMQANVDLGVNGKCVRATVNDAVVDYPATYGEGCGVHLEPGQPACQETPPADWCLQPWSYVNPCTCTASDITQATYFPGSNLYYSYGACGGADTYSTTGAGLNETASMGCPAPAPAPVSPGNWPETAGPSDNCACIPLDEARKIACSGDIAQGTGMCANSSSGLLPPNYGAECGVHFELNDQSCFKDPDTMWASQCMTPHWDVGCRKDWCDQPWCYVDNSTCTAAVTASYQFPGSPLTYSYVNCEWAAMTMSTTTTTTVTTNTTDVAAALHAASPHGFVAALVLAVILAQPESF